MKEKVRRMNSFLLKQISGLGIKFAQIKKAIVNAVLTKVQDRKLRKMIRELRKDMDAVEKQIRESKEKK